MNTGTIIEIAGIVLASTGFWQFITEWWKKKSGKKTVVAKAVLALLHDKLYYLCEKHIENGYITVDELDNLTWLFEPYEEMGGNGTCRQLFEDCKRLPKAKPYKKGA